MNLEQILHNYKDIFDNLHEGICVIDNNKKIVYWNKEAQRITGYSKEEVKGKHCWEEAPAYLDSEGKVSCPGFCPFTDSSEGKYKDGLRMYVHHKEGYRVPVLNRLIPIVNEAAVEGIIEAFKDESSEVNALARIEELTKLSLIDPLTEVGNRRYIDITIKAKLAELRRYNWSFGVLFVDIDDFKKVNDAFGHQVGDRVLVMVANTLVKNCRSFDFVGRWGGEEFIVILANVDHKKLTKIAYKFLNLIRKSHLLLENSNVVKITVSIGAAISTAGDTKDSIIKRADKFMYESKLKGKNRVSSDVQSGGRSESGSKSKV